MPTLIKVPNPAPAYSLNIIYHCTHESCVYQPSANGFVCKDVVAVNQVLLFSDVTASIIHWFSFTDCAAAFRQWVERAPCPSFLAVSCYVVRWDMNGLVGILLYSCG